MENVRVGPGGCSRWWDCGGVQVAVQQRVYEVKGVRGEDEGWMGRRRTSDSK